MHAAEAKVRMQVHAQHWGHILHTSEMEPECFSNMFVRVCKLFHVHRQLTEKMLYVESCDAFEMKWKPQSQTLSQLLPENYFGPATGQLVNESSNQPQMTEDQSAEQASSWGFLWRISSSDVFRKYAILKGSKTSGVNMKWGQLATKLSVSLNMTNLQVSSSNNSLFIKRLWKKWPWEQKLSIQKE